LECAVSVSELDALTGDEQIEFPIAIEVDERIKNGRVDRVGNDPGRKRSVTLSDVRRVASEHIGFSVAVQIADAKSGDRSSDARCLGCRKGSVTISQENGKLVERAGNQDVGFSVTIKVRDRKLGCS